MSRLLAVCLILASSMALAQPRLVVNTGHTDDVVSVSFSPDGRHVLTGSFDQTARIWDVTSGKETLRLADHDDWVMSSVYSPDGQFVATVTLDSKLTVFSAQDGKRVWQRRLGDATVNSVAYLDDDRIVSIDDDGRISISATGDGSEIVRFAIREIWPMDEFDWVSVVTISPDGDSALLGTGYGRLGLLSLAEKRLIRELDGHADEVADIAFSNDGAFALSAGMDGDVIRWDIASGEPEFTVNPRASPGESSIAATAVAVSPDDRSFLVGVETGFLFLYSASGGEALPFGERGTRPHLLGEAPEEIRVNSVAFSSDGSRVVAGGEDALAQMWTHDGTWLDGFAGLVDSVEAIAVHPDGQAIAAGSGYLDSEVSGWSLSAGINEGRLAGDSRVRSLQFSPDGEWLAYTFEAGSPVRFWHYVTEREFEIPPPFGDEATDLAFSPAAGRNLLLAYSRGQAGIWDIETGERLPDALGTFDVPVEGGQFIMETTNVSPDGTEEDTAEMVIDLGRTSAAWSPDGLLVAMGMSNEFRGENPDTQFAHVRRVDSGEWIAKLGPMEGGVNSLQFSPGDDGKYLLAASQGSASIWDIETGKERRLDHTGVVLNSAIWMPDGRRVVTAGRDRVVRVWDVAGEKVVREYRGHTGQINELRLLKGGDIIVSASQDGTIRLWDNVRGGEICQLVSFGNADEEFRGEGVSRRGGEWAVVDSYGRFDASNGGDVDGLHWVREDGEVLALAQFKRDYYEPGLLAKLLGYDRGALREVSRLSATEPVRHPDVTDVHAPDADDPVLRFTVNNRGGGIGPVSVLINGKEAVTDARPPGSDARAPAMKISLDLTRHPLLVAGRDNRIEFVTTPADGSLTSRGGAITVARNAAMLSGSRAKPLTIWTVAVGVSDYAGDKIDLGFAHTDAESFADAMRLAGSGLAPPDRVRVRLLNGGATPATRETLRKTLEEIAAKASSSDILVLYLAGHGVSHGGNDANYHYLLQDARSLDISDPAVRARVSISSEELTELIKAIPALKQVLIMDTCASGQLISDLVGSRGGSGARIRALDTLKDRTGMFVLAGSAADAESYEATPYGQGLLTFSLLRGMQGDALKADGTVDVDTLFHYAREQVPHLARGLGGIQQPRTMEPHGGSFPIGLISRENQAKIKVASPKPIVISSMFQDEEKIRDHLGLGARLDESLRDTAASRGSSFVFSSIQFHPNAYSMAGRYRIEGERISVTVVMSRGSANAGRFSVTGSTANLPELQSRIVSEMESRLK